MASSTSTNSLLLLALGVAVGELILGNYIGTFPSKMISCITANNRDDLKEGLVTFSVFILLISAVIAMKLYIADRLAVLYSRNLTQGLHSNYLEGNAFYEIIMEDTNIDNPDARITQDVNNWAHDIGTIIAKITQAPIIIVYYGYKTASILGFRTMLMCFSFSILSIVITRVVMAPVVTLTYLFEKMQGNFRLAHVTLKEDAETVCLNRAQAVEQQALSERLRLLLDTQVQLANKTVWLNLLTNVFAYFGSALVYVCIFIDTPTGMSPSSLAAFISKAAFYVISFIGGITSIVNVTQDFSRLCGYAMRISELWEILQAHKARVEQNGVGSSIELRHVYIQKPKGEILINDLTFTVSRGERVMVFGPSGSGKSSILRTIGGIWSYSRGTVTTPPAVPSTMMILTQYPYIPQKPLHESLAFPLEVCDVDLNTMYEALDFLGLEYLLVREQATWYVGLSPGERQRIAIVRVLLHHPEFLLLDEATSAIPQDLEERVFARFCSMGIALLTIAHNLQLKQYHHRSIEILPSKSYRVRTLSGNVDLPGR